MDEIQAIAYQPCYCEENIWHLCQRKDLVAGAAEVVFITGPEGPPSRVACWSQAAAESGEPVLWDYHVVLAEWRPRGVQLWDLDSRLPCPSPAELWLAATFPNAADVPRRYRPRFRVVTAEVYVRDFATDRSHMRDGRGQWLEPPPPWDPPGGPAMNLAAWCSPLVEGPGVVLARSELAKHWRP